MPSVRNTTWDELEPGREASFERACTERDLILFAHVSGNLNPRLLPDGPAEQDGAVAPAMWLASLISAALGNRLPGPGTFYRAQTLRFHDRVGVGELLRVRVRCLEKRERPLALFETEVLRASDGRPVCTGVAEVEAPLLPETVDVRALPSLILDEIDHFGPLIALAASLPPLRTAVVAPEDANSLGGALLARDRGLIAPILVGEPEAIARAAAAIGADLAGLPVEPAATHPEAAARAVALVHEGAADAIMKGALHSDELLSAIVRREGGLRTERRISHVFVMDAPTVAQLLFITDAAINITPDLATKVDIIQNAIDLAQACGVAKPRVGILSAVETVNPAIPSTLDAAILSKMAERGQIRGGIVDGPLAMDNAMDTTAARTKGITSLVAGNADVLVVPNLEAGNMLAKELTFVAKAEAAGLVVGARVPVMLTSRADNERARLASAAVAQLYAHWRRTGVALVADAPEAAGLGAGGAEAAAAPPPSAAPAGAVAAAPAGAEGQGGAAVAAAGPAAVPAEAGAAAA